MSASKVYSDSTSRDEFLYGAARAFFVSSYADYVEDEETEGDDLPHPGPGQDWMYFAPEPPPAAYALAGQLWEKLETANGRLVFQLIQDAEAADGADIDVHDFGFSCAMQAMGHGISWFDNHERFPLKVPYLECSFCSFDERAYYAEK